MLLHQGVRLGQQAGARPAVWPRWAQTSASKVQKYGTRAALAPVARQAAIPWRTWAIPSSPCPCMASAHPRKIVPQAAQCGKPCSVESATAASACSCTAGTSRAYGDHGRQHRANARLKGCDSSCANVRASWMRVRACSGYPSNQRVRAACARQATPGSWPMRNTGHGAGLACRVRCLPPGAGGQPATRPGRATSPQGIVGLDRERGVVGLLRQAQELLPELARRLELPVPIKPPQPKQDRDQLWRLPTC